MSALLTGKPYGDRDDTALLTEMRQLTEKHFDRFPAYGRIWSEWKGAGSFEELPWLHVGIFKTKLFDQAGRASRVLLSSGTSSSAQSRIVLDEEGSRLQGESVLAILSDFISERDVPLVVVDNARSLRHGGSVSARVAAALSLRGLSSEMTFVLADPDDPTSVRWPELAELLSRSESVLIYGFTSALWDAFGESEVPGTIADLLRSTRVGFVHSGGWKKLESRSVDPKRFVERLLSKVADGSTVTDFYGLVEQVGLIFPLCEASFRHVPRWAEVLVRDPWTLESLTDDDGLLQLMNPLALSMPFHSVLTEDLGRVVSGECHCGRKGHRFVLRGRVPKAEIRGCANI